VLACLCGTAGAQRNAFEGASVRPENVRPANAGTMVTGARFEAFGVTPLALIARAFGVDYGRIDRPRRHWTEVETFTVRAIMPSGATERDIPEMLQALLVDRFALKMHIEQRPYPVYELVVLPSGHKLREVAPANDLQKPFIFSTPALRDTTRGLPGQEVRDISFVDETRGLLATRRITARTSYDTVMLPGGASEIDAERMTVAELASLIFPRAEDRRAVVDKTGLTGVYQFKIILPSMRMSPALQALLGDRIDKSPSGASLTGSLAELGLKLEPREAMTDFIVVDSIERPSPE
jgi:uncharacterized protein (TIGR03435 family)